MGDKLKHIITVDGDSASGKSSVSEAIAQKFGYFHLDGGVIFRTMGFLMEMHSLDLSSLESSLDKGAIMNDVSFSGNAITYKGRDISYQIQCEEAGLRAASLGRYEYFQRWFIRYLRYLVESTSKPCIISGRIGGSIIFPSARWKFYLAADLNIKAKRRFDQLIENPNAVANFEHILQSISTRDNLQSIMHYWDIHIPESTIHIDTSFLTLADVIKSVELGIQSK